MKSRIAVLLFFLIAALACNKKDNLTSSGLLLGIDYRECASPYCGGWFIKIDKDTFRFIEIPKKTDINLNTQVNFPIRVKTVWKRYSNDWGKVNDLILVEELWRK